jgi:murein DD-endopeptidase MepM/ murein hydrolase activator NlpD
VAAAVLILGGSLAGFVLASVPSHSPDATSAEAVTGIDGGVSPFGLPFVTGTSIEIAQGPHAVNYRSVPGYTFTGASSVAASLDLATRSAGVAVVPVAAGRVLAAWPECNVVVVDHGGGTWVEYVHLQLAVTTGQTVGRNSTLGYILGAYDHRNTTCGDFSSGPHLHFAFINGSGSSGTYASIAGRVLCGRTVDGSGNIGGLGSVGGAWFSVPDCEGTGQPVITPTPKPVITATPKPVITATPKPVITATPKPVITATPESKPPVSSCNAPSLDAPGSGSSLGSTQDVSLSWATNCSQTYAELSGSPYGTLSFGGWQTATSVHIGQMWPGSYTWHVKGKSASGQETGWSATRSFTIQNAAGPIVTSPPAPIVTNPPAPIVTNPPAPIVTTAPTQCPFRDGGTGVTFYAGANFTGQSWTWYVPAGHNDTYSDLPAGLYRNLGSFHVSNNAWHVVLYQGENGTGNLGHYDASWAAVDSYWRTTESVKIYINRSC